jgi:hypothetical protein
MLHEPLAAPAPSRRFTRAFAGNVTGMNLLEKLESAIRSPAGRAAGLLVAAALATFLAGYVIFGPIALRLLPR